MTMTPDTALGINPAALAQALGVPLFQTDLHMPNYRAGQVGRWRLGHSGFNMDHGYYSGPCAQFGMPILMRDEIGDGRGWETWMSLSAHEIESQELGCRYARGHTVIMGLGMGWVAINSALNPAVSKVTVIERDVEVIELFQHMHALDDLNKDALRKIRIVQADALEWQPDIPVDFLYADIWRCLEEPQTLDDVRRMQTNVCAETIYFWGQELAIGAPAELSQVKREAWPSAVQACVAEKIGLPLLLPQNFDYPGMIAEVIRSRRSRKSPMASSNIPQSACVRSPAKIRNSCSSSMPQHAKKKRSLSAGPMISGRRFCVCNLAFNMSNTCAIHAQLRQAILRYRAVRRGGAIGRLYVERTEQGIHIIDLSLQPAHCGHGIGSSLIANIIQEAKAASHQVSLQVQKGHRAIALYRRLGFKTAADNGASWVMTYKKKGAAKMTNISRKMP